MALAVLVWNLPIDPMSHYYALFFEWTVTYVENLIYVCLRMDSYLCGDFNLYLFKYDRENYRKCLIDHFLSTFLYSLMLKPK